MYLAIFCVMRFFRLIKVERDIQSSAAISTNAHSLRRYCIISSSSSEKPQCSRNSSHSSLKNLNFKVYLPPDEKNQITTKRKATIKVAINILCRLIFLFKSFTTCQPTECLRFTFLCLLLIKLHQYEPQYPYSGYCL